MERSNAERCIANKVGAVTGGKWEKKGAPSLGGGRLNLEEGKKGRRIRGGFPGRPKSLGKYLMSSLEEKLVGGGAKRQARADLHKG